MGEANLKDELLCSLELMLYYLHAKIIVHIILVMLIYAR